MPPSQGLQRLLGQFVLGRRVHRVASSDRRWLSEALDLAGESPLGDVGDIGRDRGADLLAELGVVPDEPGAELLDQAQHVVDDEDLAVALRAGADADGRDREPAR